MAGAVFVRIRPLRVEDGLTVPLQLQMLPSEMLPLHETGVARNGNAIRQGIEFDRIGRRVAYHFLRGTLAIVPIRGYRARSCAFPPVR